MKSIVNVSLKDLDQAAEEILAYYPDQRVFAFFGPMGAGKTTLIKAICHALNVVSNTSSPTFAIVNEYDRKDAGLVYHFDFYRIKSESEARDIGFDDYLYSGNYCFMEWPEKIPTLLTRDYVEIRIEVKSDDIRDLYLKNIVHEFRE